MLALVVLYFTAIQPPVAARLYAYDGVSVQVFPLAAVRRYGPQYWSFGGTVLFRVSWITRDRSGVVQGHGPVGRSGLDIRPGRRTRVLPNSVAAQSIFSNNGGHEQAHLPGGTQKCRSHQR
jgi:hypothetical protein